MSYFLNNFKRILFFALIFHSPLLLAETIYVSNEKDNTLSIIDGKALEVIKTIKVGQRPRGLIMDKEQKYLYICASDDDTIQILDLATNEIVGTLPSGPDPELMAISPGQQNHICCERRRQHDLSC